MDEVVDGLCRQLSFFLGFQQPVSEGLTKECWIILHILKREAPSIPRVALKFRNPLNQVLRRSRELRIAWSGQWLGTGFRGLDRFIVRDLILSLHCFLGNHKPRFQWRGSIWRLVMGRSEGTIPATAGYHAALEEFAWCSRAFKGGGPSETAPLFPWASVAGVYPGSGVASAVVRSMHTF